MTVVGTVEDGQGNIIEQTVDNGDGTGTRTTYDAEGNVTSTETVTGLPLPPPPTVEDAIPAFLALTVEATLLANEDKITPEQAVALSPLVTPWAPGDTVAVDALRSHDGDVWQVVQAHTTQADWTPDATPALWKRWRNPEAGPQPWVQPQGAHDAYQIGDRVTHGGQTWESTAANNVWAPGVFGWVVV